SSFRFASKLLELGCRNRQWLFPRKIGTCKTDEKQPASGRSGLGSLITPARDPRLCYENYFPIDFASLAWPVESKTRRKMNIKKCLLTIVSGILITAVTHAQEASEDLTAEQHQLAQRKA